MAEAVVLDPQVLARKTALWSARVQQRYDFNAEVARRDASRGRLSFAATTAAESIEQFLGTASAFRETLQKAGSITGNYKAKESFVDLFSCYAGAAFALAWLQKQQPSDERFPLKKHALDFSRGDLLLEDLVGCVLKDTTLVRSGSQLVSAAKTLYEWVSEEALSQKDNPAYADFVKRAESTHIKMGDTLIAGFSARQFSAEQSVVPCCVSRDAYVGNRELLDTLTGVMTELLDYDLKAKKNPNVSLGGMRQTVTVWGEGGMGKSTGIALVLGETKVRADNYHIPFVVKELRGFKSEYYGKSAQNLRDLFKDVHKGDAVYVIVAEDIDTLFFARDELKNRAEDKDVLGEFMNQLEGVASGGKGNYVLIATSNHPLEGDGALMARLRQCQVQVKGPQTAQEYGAVYRAQLRDGIRVAYVQVKDWDSIGQVAREHKLANRDVRNICYGLQGAAKPTERVDAFYSLSHDERVAVLAKQHKVIVDQDVRDATLAYARGLERQKGANHG